MLPNRNVVLSLEAAYKSDLAASKVLARRQRCRPCSVSRGSPVDHHALSDCSADDGKNTMMDGRHLQRRARSFLNGTVIFASMLLVIVLHNNGFDLQIVGSAVLIISFLFALRYVLDTVFRTHLDGNFNKMITVDLDQFIKTHPIVLYLRSFDQSASYQIKVSFRRLRDVILNFGLCSFPGVASPAADPERDFDRLFNEFAVVAIGDKYGTFGSRKLHCSDDEWQRYFDILAEASGAIVYIVGGTRCSVWELLRITASDALAQKVILVLPPGYAPNRFLAAFTTFDLVGCYLPDYSEDGWICNLTTDGADLCHLPYWRFMETAPKHLQKVGRQLGSAKDMLAAAAMEGE